MAYTRKTWKNGEVITEAGLNNIEEGISEAKTAANSAASTAQSAKITANEALNKSVLLPQIICTADSSITFTAKCGSTTLTQTGKSVVFNLPTYGEWTVSCTVNGNTASETYTIDAVKQYRFIAYAPVLANNSWDAIAHASASGKAAEIWSVGDEINITANGETLTLVIVGFNHDDLADGSGKAGITFGMKHLMANTRPINSSGTSVGGFKSSELYAWLSGALLPAFPADLLSVIKSVNKGLRLGNGSVQVSEEALQIFLFSMDELFGPDTSFYGEGNQYPYFATTESRQKRLANGAGAGTQWWSRSPGASSATPHRWGCIGTGASPGGGGANSTTPNYSYGVCFGFCV